MPVSRFLFPICIMLMATFASPAAAQDSPPITRNRVICPSMKALVRAVEMLPNVGAIRSNSTLPDEAGQPDKKTGAPGCSWLGGTFPIPTDNPIGWVYAGEYMVLINALDVGNGRKFLIVSAIVSRREWRLQDDCAKMDFWGKTKLPTGDSYYFFGQRRRGFDRFCRNLVNTITEAKELNEPRRDLSEVWKSRPYWRNMIACQSLDGLAASLDTVVNEQQVSNSDTATFTMRNGCIFRSVDEIIASRFLGIYRTSPATGSGPVFFVEIHEVLHLNKRTGVVTSAFMPTTPMRERSRRLEGACARSTQIPNRGSRSIVLYGTSLGDVDGISISTSAGRRSIGALRNTPIGDPGCELNEISLRRNNN